VPVWRIDVPPHVAGVIRHLPPEVKARVKAALRALAGDPSVGEPFAESRRLWKYRVRRYRLVYAVERRERTVESSR